MKLVEKDPLTIGGGAAETDLTHNEERSLLVENQLNDFSLKARELWRNRYPCGKNGGWVHYRVMDDKELTDVYRFIHAKKKPV